MRPEPPNLARMDHDYRVEDGAFVAGSLSPGTLIYRLDCFCGKRGSWKLHSYAEADRDRHADRVDIAMYKSETQSIHDGHS